MALSPRESILALRDHVDACIVGQQRLVERLIVTLLAGGHLLVEGVPGLAKTSAVKVLAAGLEGSFHRIQFTPDLLPADLTGTDVFNPREASFAFQQGPLFNHFLLADEINRAPAKVQSALLEAMEERQVTVGNVSYPLPKPFMVMATQNPIEQDGTYPLPEAQLDRFLFHVRVDYPSREHEQAIMRLVRERLREGGTVADQPGPRIRRDQLLAAQKEILAVELAPALEAYIVRLVQATRQPAPYRESLADWVQYGASPRAALALDLAGRALAWLAGRDYVSPDDLHQLAPDVLRHRLLLSYRAEAEGVTPDDVIGQLLTLVAVP